VKPKDKDWLSRAISRLHELEKFATTKEEELEYCRLKAEIHDIVVLLQGKKIGENELS